MTNGHLDVVARAARLVDRLVVGVAVNIGKAPLFSLEERVELVGSEIAEIANRQRIAIEVRPFSSLLIHFARDVGASIIIRGLRAVFGFRLRVPDGGHELSHGAGDRDRVPDGERKPPVHRVAARQGSRELWAETSRPSSRTNARTRPQAHRPLIRRGIGKAILVGRANVSSNPHRNSRPGSRLLMSEAATAENKLDPENTLYLDLKYGRVVIQLLPDLAPKHVARVKELTREGFYDNTPFHRVIPGFMAQGGDPTGTGTGGSKLPNLPAEFTHKAHFLRGTVGAARTQIRTPPTASSSSASRRRRSSTASRPSGGRVVSGMEYVDQIKKGSGSQRHGFRSRPDRADAGRGRRQGLRTGPALCGPVDLRRVLAFKARRGACSSAGRARDF